MSNRNPASPTNAKEDAESDFWEKELTIYSRNNNRNPYVLHSVTATLVCADILIWYVYQVVHSRSAQAQTRIAHVCTCRDRRTARVD